MNEIDVIDQKLNTILGVDVEDVVENKEVPAIIEPNEIVEVVENNDLVPADVNNDDNEFNEDFHFARDNMKEISKIGMQSIKELSTVARDSQTPRIYEVLSKMMKDVSDINATIIDNHSKKIAQQPVEESSSIKVNSVENAIFCTSADMLRKIKNHNK